MLTCRAQGGGVTLRVVKDIGAFSRITVGRNMNVTLVMADEVHLLPKDVVKRITPLKKGGVTPSHLCIVKAEPSVSKAVDCATENGSLAISAQKFKFRRTKRIDVFVICDSTLTLISGATGGNITTRGCLRLGNVTVRANDAQHISLSATAKSVRVEATIRSSVRLTGKSNTIDATLGSASSLDAQGMTCNQLYLTAENESRATAAVREAATVSAKGGSSVTMRTAKGAKIDVDEDGSAVIVKPLEITP